MPNWVRNVVKIRKIPEKEIPFITNLLASKSEMTGDLIFDLHKIVPEPGVKEDCPEDCLMTECSHSKPLEDRPWFDWYEWRNKYWGTKWEACDGYTYHGKSYVVFVFSTAWSAPFMAFEKLQVLGLDIEIRYADEDYGTNCGMLAYSSLDKKWTEWTEEDLARDSINPRKFASRLWSNY